jgi:hypothetical protein
MGLSPDVPGGVEIGMGFVTACLATESILALAAKVAASLNRAIVANGSAF